MSRELTNDDLDDLEVELAQVEQTLRLLADDHVDPVQSIEWLSRTTDLGSAEHGAPDLGSTVDELDDGETLAAVVKFPGRPAD